MTIMQAIQERFQQFFIEKRKMVASITMSDADYDALVVELLPQREWTEIERELLGEARMAELDLSKYRTKGIAKILDYTDSNYVAVYHDATVGQGTFILSEAKA